MKKLTGASIFKSDLLFLSTMRRLIQSNEGETSFTIQKTINWKLKELEIDNVYVENVEVIGGSSEEFNNKVEINNKEFVFIIDTIDGYRIFDNEVLKVTRRESNLSSDYRPYSGDIILIDDGYSLDRVRRTKSMDTTFLVTAKLKKVA